MAAQIGKMAAFGLNLKQCATIIGIGAQTLERRLKEDSQLLNMVEAGRSIAINNVAEALYTKATVDRDTTAMIFFLKCRARWKEPRPEDIEHEERSNFKNLSLDDKIEHAKAALAYLIAKKEGTNISEDLNEPKKIAATGGNGKGNGHDHSEDDDNVQ